MFLAPHASPPGLPTQIRHDLPRPPTVITDKFGDTLVKAYGGPGVGVQTMKASEWEPFTRTMPHSEFPSASSCLCQVRRSIHTSPLKKCTARLVWPSRYANWTMQCAICNILYAMRKIQCAVYNVQYEVCSRQFETARLTR